MSKTTLMREGIEINNPLTVTSEDVGKVVGVDNNGNLALIEGGGSNVIKLWEVTEYDNIGSLPAGTYASLGITTENFINILLNYGSVDVIERTTNNVESYDYNCIPFVAVTYEEHEGKIVFEAVYDLENNILVLEHEGNVCIYSSRPK